MLARRPAVCVGLSWGKALLRVSQGHETALRHDDTMEVEGVTDENKLVHQALAEAMWLLHDGVSAAYRAEVVAAYHTGTLHVVAMTYDDVEFSGDACDEVVVVGTERGKSAGDGLTVDQLMKA